MEKVHFVEQFEAVKRFVGAHAGEVAAFFPDRIHEFGAGEPLEFFGMIDSACVVPAAHGGIRQGDPVRMQSGRIADAVPEIVHRFLDLFHLGGIALDLHPAECRGKLVLMRSFEDAAGLGAASGISLRWDDQSAAENTALHMAAYNNGTYTLYVQDRSGYSDEEKWQAFTSGMAVGSRETSGGAISLNFLSSNGALYYGHPYSHASVLNAALRNRGENLGGWIIVDFGEPYLERMVYSSKTYPSFTGPAASFASSDETPQLP